jgi:hypothetical protein
VVPAGLSQQLVESSPFIRLKKGSRLMWLSNSLLIVALAMDAMAILRIKPCNGSCHTALLPNQLIHIPQNQAPAKPPLVPTRSQELIESVRVLLLFSQPSLHIQ